MVFSRFRIRSFAALAFLLLLLSACSLPYSKPAPRQEVRKMIVTGYDAGQKSTGWTYGPNEGKRKMIAITSDGTKVKKGTIAADIRRYPYGTRMFVPGYGWGEVHDTGSDIKGDHIDLFFPDIKDALKWGRKYLEVIIERR